MKANELVRRILYPRANPDENRIYRVFSGSCEFCGCLLKVPEMCCHFGSPIATCPQCRMTTYDERLCELAAYPPEMRQDKFRTVVGGIGYAATSETKKAFIFGIAAVLGFLVMGILVYFIFLVPEAPGLFGYSAVFPGKNMPNHFLTSVKRRGALIAKGRLLGVQFDALFTDDLYFRISRHAIEMAEKLRNILSAHHLPFYIQSPTNQQFVILENRMMETLSRFASFSFWEKADETHTVVRFATGWSTKEEDLSILDKALSESEKFLRHSGEGK